MKAKAGFSLLEALVALGVAAICLAAIFDIQHQLVNGQRRAEAIMARAELRRNVLTLLRDVTPGSNTASLGTTGTSGTLTAPPDLTVTWTATPIADQKVNDAFPTGLGNFNVQLYRIQAEARDGQGRAVDHVTIERMGWALQQTAAAAAAGGAAGSTNPRGNNGPGRSPTRPTTPPSAVR